MNPSDELDGTVVLAAEGFHGIEGLADALLDGEPRGEPGGQLSVSVGRVRTPSSFGHVSTS
jgi:hypothetical protein